MRKSGIFNISLEDEDVLNNVEGEEQVDVVEAIASEEEAVEFQEQASELEADGTSLEESEEVVADLQDQVETQEEIIENNPEAVTEDTVQVAQEAFMVSAARLGKTYEELKVKRISHESASEHPLSAFKLATEDMSEFIAKVIEQIKAVFAKIARGVRNLIAKAAVMMGSVESKAKGLLEKMKKESGEIKYDEADLETLAEKSVAIGVRSQDVVDTVNKFFASGVYDKLTAVIKDDGSIDETKFRSVSKETVEMIKGSKNVLLKTMGENVDDRLPIIVRVGKSSMYCVTDEGEFKNFALEISDNNKSDGGLGTIENVKKLLEAVQKHSKGLKTWADKCSKAQDNLQKRLDKIAKGKDNQSADSKKTLRLTRTLGSQVYMHHVLYGIDLIKGGLAAAAFAYSVQQGKKKEEKENKDK